MVKTTLEDLPDGASEAHLAIENNESHKLIDFEQEELLRTDEDGETPLHYAGTMGDLRGCKILIRKCPEIINMRDKDGKTAYDHAVEYSEDQATIDYLKEFQFGVGSSKAHHAVENKDYVTLMALTSEEILSYNIKGETPLHYAAILADLEACALIINKCPEIIHIKDNDGKTAKYHSIHFSQCESTINYFKQF